MPEMGTGLIKTGGSMSCSPGSKHLKVCTSQLRWKQTHKNSVLEWNSKLRWPDCVLLTHFARKECLNWWTFEWWILLNEEFYYVMLCVYIFTYWCPLNAFLLILINLMILINMCIQISMNGIGEESMNGIGEEMKGGRESIDKESCTHNCHHPEGWN